MHVVAPSEVVDRRSPTPVPFHIASRPGGTAVIDLPPSTSIPGTSPDIGQLVLVMSGAIVIQLENERWVAQAGSVTIIPTDGILAILNAGSTPARIIGFAPTGTDRS